MTRRGKIIPGLVLAILIAWVAAGYGQATASFDGKITAISKATSLGPGETATFFIVRLDSNPKMEFRISPEDAVKFGLIEAAGSSGVLTSKQIKGFGWKVKLTCSKEEQAFRPPVYRVRSLERMHD